MKKRRKNAFFYTFLHFFRFFEILTNIEKPKGKVQKSVKTEKFTFFTKMPKMNYFAFLFLKNFKKGTLV